MDTTTASGMSDFRRSPPAMNSARLLPVGDVTLLTLILGDDSVIPWLVGVIGHDFEVAPLGGVDDLEVDEGDMCFLAFIGDSTMP